MLRLVGKPCFYCENTRWQAIVFIYWVEKSALEQNGLFLCPSGSMDDCF